MKLDTLIEALQTAGEAYKKKHKKEMEIFDFIYDDPETAGIRVEACAGVTYVGGEFGGSKNGKRPLENIIIRFEIEDGKIDDRSIELEDAEDD